MAIFKQHKHGTFSWVELATTDSAAAKKFYGGLFGWTFDDMPVGPDMTYTMCKVGEHTAAALYAMGKDTQNVPPNWLSYVAVDDVDASTKKAAQSGGKVVKEPFDVMDVGRMAVLQDPSGATFAMWQAKKHIGAEIMHDPGTMCWHELMTTNVDAAGKFYVQTIGWTTTAMDMGPMGTYTILGRPGEDPKAGGGVAGMMAMPRDMKNVPSHWLAYFAAIDVDASTKKASQLGGKVLVPPTDIPNIGRFSVVEDPQGATFALYKNAH